MTTHLSGPAAPPVMASAMSELRSATWPVHQRLEKRLQVRGRFSQADGYRAHLEGMWGFCAGLEHRLESTGIGDALQDYDARRKLPLLARDLGTLGLSSAALAELPVCRILPACPDTASALGCLYVIEGSTLGGQTLAPLVHRQLGFNADRGAAFLTSYGSRVGAMWRAFGSALEAWCRDPERRMRSVQAAIGTFEALETWLCGRAS